MLTKVQKFYFIFIVIPLIIYTSVYSVNKSDLMKMWRIFSSWREKGFSVFFHIKLHIASEFILSFFTLIIGVTFFILTFDYMKIISGTFVLFNIRSLDDYLKTLYMKSVYWKEGDKKFLLWIQNEQNRNAVEHNLFKKDIESELGIFSAVLTLVVVVFVCIML